MRQDPHPQRAIRGTQSPDRFFPATSWTLVRRAAQKGQDPNAVNEFIERYYIGVTAFIATIVQDDTLAEELTHEFFEARIIDSRRMLEAASQEKGRFRDLLKTTLRHFVIDRHFRRLKKQRETEVEPDGLPGAWDTIEINKEFAKAEHALIRGWGETLLLRALARTKERCEERGQQEHFEMFKRRYIDDPDQPPSFHEVGLPFSIDEKIARSRIVTVVTQFRAVLLELIRNDAGVERSPRDEILDLLATL